MRFTEADFFTEMMWSRRRFLSALAKSTLVVGGAGVLGAIAEACGTSSPTATPSGSAAFWTWRQPDVDLFKSVTQKFSGVTLQPTVSPATEYDAKLLTAMQANEGPDFFHGRTGVGYYKPYADAGQLLDLTGSVPDLKKNFPQSALDSTSLNGKVYAVPSDIDVTAFLLNKSAVPEITSADGPSTWADFMALGREIKGKGLPFIFLAGKDSWTLGFNVAGIAATDLPDSYVSDLLAGKAKFTDDPFVGVLQKLKDLTALAQPGYQASSYDDMMAAVANGKAAGMMLGTWVPGDLKKANPNIDLHQFLSPPDQSGTARKAAYFYGGGWAINAKAKNQPAALELVQYAATAGFGQLITDQQSIITPMAPNTNPSVSDKFLARTEALSKNTTPKTWWQFSALDSGNPGINTLLPPAAQGVITGQLTPKQAAAQIQQGLASWFKFS